MKGTPVTVFLITSTDNIRCQLYIKYAGEVTKMNMLQACP